MKLAFTSQKGPEADFQILNKVRFARITDQRDRWLNRPWDDGFWNTDTREKIYCSSHKEGDVTCIKR